MSATGYAAWERDSTGSERAIPFVPNEQVSYRATEANAAYEIHPAAFFDLHFDLHTQRGNGYWIVWDAQTAIYGYGRRLSKAREDFQTAARQHLEVLESEENLSEELAWQLEYLRARIGR